MSWFAIYAFYGSPVVLLLIGLALYYFTGKQDRLHPGE